ncbi:CLUMA_CG017600, isoform A [Clunio marinus]|uniref:CLUMA_CG017600, isoform A n=1 Tax=Clunio marinus TaxID=568069 RepID=A0A1J1IWD4_9DIPT|nr:CLUMA_CG017600, isoform A [Clunio marinus]
MDCSKDRNNNKFLLAESKCWEQKNCLTCTDKTAAFLTSLNSPSTPIDRCYSSSVLHCKIAKKLNPKDFCNVSILSSSWKSLKGSSHKTIKNYSENFTFSFMVT